MGTRALGASRRSRPFHVAEVLFTRRALRDLDKLEAKDRESVLNALAVISGDPLRTARKLRDPRIGAYRYRVGDLRIIFDFERGNVLILRVGHRREIYR